MVSQIFITDDFDFQYTFSSKEKYEQIVEAGCFQESSYE